MLAGIAPSMMVSGASSGGGGGGSPVVLNSAHVEHIVVDPLDAQVTLVVGNTGQVTATGQASYTWCLTGTPSGYDVSFDSGFSWQNLGTSRSISRSRTSIGISQATYDARIRNASTLVELARATITLWAEVS